MGGAIMTGSFRDAKINDFHLSFISQEDILGVDIPMDDIQGFALQIP